MREDGCGAIPTAVRERSQPSGGLQRGPQGTSARAIADKIGVDQKTVLAARKAIEENSSIDGTAPARVDGCDGEPPAQIGPATDARRRGPSIACR
jgi:hypothetical protein